MEGGGERVRGGGDRCFERDMRREGGKGERQSTERISRNSD